MHKSDSSVLPPGFELRYAIRMISGNAGLDRRYESDMVDLVDRWQDEAAEAAVGIVRDDGSILDGNPRRAGYIEYMISRVPDMMIASAERAAARAAA